VQIGSPLSNVLNSTQLGQAWTAILRNSNNFTGGLQVAKSNTLQIETGAGPNGQTPLGTGYVEVYGTLQNSGLASSFVNAATGLNANNLILRPAALVIVNDIAGVSPAGGQGRWSDTQVLELNGATFSFVGAAGAPSTETIGVVNVSKAGTVLVTKGSAPGYATLTLAGFES
jgi:hypothetical protein